MLTLDYSPVHSHPELLGGTLVFIGTRVPAQTLLDYLDDGFSLEEFLEMFSSVQREDAAEFLRLARGQTDENHSRREPAKTASYIQRPKLLNRHRGESKCGVE